MKLQIKRTLAQIGIFISANLGPLGLKTGFCYPFFYCNSCPAATSACPLRALEVGVFQNSFKWKLILFPLLIIGSLGIITGRAICGWACPIGWLQRLTAPVARKLKKYPIIQKIAKLPIESKLRYMKYLLLIGLVFITTYLIGFMFTNICPIGFLTGTIPTLVLFPNDFVINPLFFIPSLVIFILFIILIFTIERGWCRYFCPLGALFAPFNKISMYHVSRVEQETFEKECLHCNACTNICPMGIEVTTLDRDPECILCGKCVTICPKNLLEFKRR